MSEIIVKSEFEESNEGLYSNVFDLIDSKLADHPENIAFMNSLSGEKYSKGWLRQAIDCVASHLMDMGLIQGDTMAFYSTNCIECIITVFAVWRIGGTVALLNAMATTADVKREIGRTNSKILFTNHTNINRADLSDEKNDLKVLISNNNVADDSVHFSSLVDTSGRSKLPQLSSMNIDPATHNMAILFSSGTTGLPKAVQITHKSFICQLSICDHYAFDVTSGPVLLMFQPIAHIYGLGLAVIGIYKGYPTEVMPQFTLDGYLSLVEKYRVKTLALVPPVTVLLAKSGLIQKYDISCVEYILNAAAPLPHEVEDDIIKQMNGRVKFLQGYGLTETTGMVISSPLPSFATKQPTQKGTIGVLAPGVQAKVVDPSTGKTCGPNQEGELVFITPTAMKGYLGDAGSTAATIDQSGWLYTGDIGFYDEHNYFYIVDRLKELIKYNALQVSPTELEGVILTHPAVADVAVVGKPDSIAGELPMAWVVTKPGHTVTEQDIANFVAGLVAPFKKLRGGVQFVESIPKSPSGKILRKDIKAAISKTLTSSKL